MSVTIKIATIPEMHGDEYDRMIDKIKSTFSDAGFRVRKVTTARLALKEGFRPALTAWVICDSPGTADAAQATACKIVDTLHEYNKICNSLSEGEQRPAQHKLWYGKTVWYNIRLLEDKDKVNVRFE